MSNGNQRMERIVDLILSLFIPSIQHAECTPVVDTIKLSNRRVVIDQATTREMRDWIQLRVYIGRVAYSNRTTRAMHPNQLCDLVWSP